MTAARRAARADSPGSPPHANSSAADADPPPRISPRSHCTPSSIKPGAEACKHAATILGIEPPDHTGWKQLLADATSANQLARLAGAVACGIAETLAYHQSTGTVRAWFQLLVSHGWEPDDWTVSRLNRTDNNAEAFHTGDVNINEGGAVA